MLVAEVQVSIDRFKASEEADIVVGDHRLRHGDDRVGERLKGHWCIARNEGQEAWAYCFTEGLVSETTALGWRDEVWCEETEE